MSQRFHRSLAVASANSPVRSPMSREWIWKPWVVRSPGTFRPRIVLALWRI